MAVPVELMIFRDARALAHYLAGAMQTQPGILSRRCLVLTVAPEGADPEAPPQIALQVGDDPQALPLPKPEGFLERARVVQAEVDLDARKLRVLGPGRGILRRTSVAETLEITGADARSNIVQAVPLEPWEKEPEQPEVVFVAPPGEPFSALVTDHLELGNDSLRFASTFDPEHGPLQLLEVARPSWFLLSRWLDRNGGSGNGNGNSPHVTAFRRLPRRRTYVVWGKRHPLEAFLPEPDQDSLLFVDDEGRYRTLRSGAWNDIGSALALEGAKLETRSFEAANDPGRIPVRLRLEGRPRPRDPELWLLEAQERSRLERLLAQTPEEELKNLLVALVARPDGSRFFVVREVLAGRAARLLPIGGQAYAALPGLPGLFLPCEKTLAPPLRNDRYARAFAVKAGELTLLDSKPDGSLSVSRLRESVFRPIDAVIDFVVDSEAARIEAVILSAPFDLGRFAEEDLVPPDAAPERRRKRAVEQDVKAREPADEEPPESSSPAKLAALRNLLPEKEPEAAHRAPRSATREQETPLRAQVATLERELAREPGDAARWGHLADLRFEEKDEEEAVRAAENALWLARTGEEETTLRASLVERLGNERDGATKPVTSSSPSEAAAVYRSVFAFARAARDSQDQDAIRAQATQVHDLLRSLEPRLRKKTRWLAWREVLSVTGDRVEEERQREDVLADLVLRGVEDREVPAFVRQRLLERYSSGATSGTAGAAEALDFLGEAVSFATATDKQAHRAAALAHVAWAHAELGQAERARSLAREAERNAQEAKGEAEQAYRARALARSAAVLERLDGPNAGRRLFQESLDAIAKGLESRPQRSAEERKAFAKWFQALADARAAQAQPDDPLVLAGIARLEKIEQNLRAIVLEECADALARLGQSAKGRQIARSLLARSDLQLIHLDHAAKALETFEEGRAVVVEDGRRILDVVRKAPAEIDEFVPETIVVALRADPRPTAEVSDELASALAKDGYAYASLLVRLAALRRLAELKDRDLGPRLLARTFDEAWKHPDDSKGEHRMRLLVRLANLIPAFGLRATGLELLRKMKDRARTERLYNRNELLSACALAVAKLGETREAMRIVDEVVDEVLALVREPGRDERVYMYIFEALDAAATAAAELGDAKWALPLVARIAQAARNALGPPTERRVGTSADPGIFFCYRALIRCGKAAVMLGERDAAQGYFDDALARLGETFGMDRMELLEETAKAANELEGTARYDLASRVLKLARGVLDLGEFSRQFAVDLAERVAQDVVKGESAYAAALKRWKGDEERRIRDRVVSERVCT